MKLVNTVASIALLFGLSACGGGGGSDGDSGITTYDFWDYLKTNNLSYSVDYDVINTDVNGEVLASAFNDNKSDFTEDNNTITDYNTDNTGETSKTIYTKSDSSIHFKLTSLNEFDISREVIVGETIGTTKYSDLNITLQMVFTKAMDTFQIHEDYETYSDVIEITFNAIYNENSLSHVKYNVIKNYFAKGVGYIGHINRNCWVNDDTNDKGYTLDDAQLECTNEESIAYEMVH